MLTIFFIVSISFLWISPIYAGEPPTLTSPSNGSTVTSSTLNWQAPAYQLYSSSPYKVQVDDDSSFASLNKDYYTDNTHYTPTLNAGTWYWRVKAKDLTGIWSDWSSSWSFNLSTNTPTPSNTTPPERTPIPTSTSTQPSDSTQSTSSFIISNVPSQVDSDQTFSVSVDLFLPNNPDTTFYLKGAFKKGGSSNYFGKTKVLGSWVKNSASYSTQYQITTDPLGKWSGHLEVMPDADDSGYKGSDDYTFKVGRYSQSGSGPTWSSEETIKIVNVSSNHQDDSPTVSDNSDSPIKQAVNPSPTLKNRLTSKITKSSSNQSVYKTASVAAATASAMASSTPVTNIETKSSNQINFLPIIGALLIFSGIVSLIFVYLRSKKDL